MATTTYLRLFPAVKQFELKNGALNVGGRLFVYYEGTDDLAEIYDENGSRLQQPAILDNDGRALGLFVDAKKVYRLEVQDAFGAMQFTVRKMAPSGGGAGSALGKTYDVVSNDGSILVDTFDEGGTTTFDLSLGIDANELKPSCLKASAAPVTTDGKFVFEELVREGNLVSVDGEGKVRMEPAWYHFTAIVELSYDGTPVNEAHQVTLWTTLSNSVIDLDTSYAHRESIELSGDIHVIGNNTEFPLGVSGLDTGITASLIGFDIHAVTGHEGNNEYHAGEGITIVNATKTISADFDSVQEKLVAGDNISITGNVISAGNFSQEQADWTEDDTESPAYIRNKPDLDIYATQAQLSYGLAGKQDVISDLAAIRSGATAGASAVQPADLAAVATTGDYNSLNNRPNLTVYATKTEVNTGLAAKQDVISDLSAIRAGAQAGSTAVQPATLDSYATKVELNTGLSGKQDTINDLSEIRSGAAAGSTAVQPADLAEVATTGDYDSLTNKPSIPTQTSDLTNDSGFITSADVPVKDVQVDGASVVNAQGVAEITMPDLSGYATTQALNTGLAGKQDTISDLATIRSGAAAGASAVQPGDLATVAVTGSYTDLSNQPTIPSGAQLVPAATASDVKKVLTVNSLGTPEWAESQGLFIAVYGTTSYNDIHAAAGAGKIVYCYVNGRFAFLAFTNAAGSDRNYEFQYYRSAPSGIDSVFIYKVRPAGSSWGPEWETTQRAVKAGNISYPVTQVNVNGASAMTGTVANITIPAAPTVDQTYDASSTNAQSGTAVAQAIASIPSSSYTAGTGIDITNNVVSVDTSVVATQTDLAGKQDTISDLATIRSGAAEGATAVQPGDMNTALAGKQDVIQDLSTIRSGAAAGATAVQPSEMASALADKQDVISDLSTIRSGAAAGATAVQDPDYVHTDENFTSAEKTKLAGIEAGAQVNVNADWNAASGTDAYIANKPQNLVQDANYVHTDENFTSSEKTKLAGIEAGAQVNVKPDWNAAAGSDAEILNKPTIPSGTQLVPVATSADADKVLTVDSQGTPAWASAQAPISAGDGIDITNNVVSAKVDGTTIDTNSSGELTVIGGGGDGADWTAEQGEPGYIENKPVPKTLTAGTGISITENQSTITIANTVTAATLGIDKTVLFEDLTVDGTVVASVVLSETSTNFEEIEITVGWKGGSTSVSAPGRIIFKCKPDGIYYGFGGLVGCDNSSHFVLGGIGTSGTTLSLKNVMDIYSADLSTITPQSFNNILKVYKVVGIHRIASN